ncbi:hypothetical protein MTCD1_01348 [Colwellia marinimaniae]|uniref:Uncharacterized protein n=1 Tax=Colwellia marinimaniae TaxID=1513592 RepID=A0ABQ0MTQ6_9GAMM|nr:hypothetical protein MTCD1_01348 [Colwellia marinimaniae]
MALISKSAAAPQPSTSNIFIRKYSKPLFVIPVGGNLFALVPYALCHGCDLLDNADGTGSTLLENAGAYSPDVYKEFLSKLQRYVA